MRQENLAKWLKAIIIGVAVCLAIGYGMIIPMVEQELSAAYPEFSYAVIPWFLFLFIALIPVVIALIYCWKIASEIQKDNSFSRINADYLKRISFLAVTDAVFFFVGNVLFIILNMSIPMILLISLFIVFLGVASAVVTASLSHLVYKAAVMREENDLTI